MTLRAALKLAIEALVIIRRQHHAFMAHQEGEHPEVETAKREYKRYTEAIELLTKLKEAHP